MPASAWISQVFCVSFPVVGLGNEAPGSLRDLAGRPTSGRTPLENVFIWNRPITSVCGFYVQESGGVPAGAFVLMKHPRSLPCWWISPSLRHPVFNLGTVLFGGWGEGDWLRRTEFGVILSRWGGRRCQLISLLFRWKRCWFFCCCFFLSRGYC